MSFSDDFTGSADQELQDRSGWTRLTTGNNRFVISSGGDGLAGKSAGGSGKGVYICTDQGSGDHETSIDNTETTYTAFPCAVRIVDQDNWVSGRYGGSGGGGFRLVKSVSGTTTEIIATQGDNILPFTMKVSAEGDQYKLFEDGDQRGTTQTISDGDISTSETSQGMIQDALSAGGTKYFDNFLAAALGAPPSSSIPVIMNQLRNQGIN